MADSPNPEFAAEVDALAARVTAAVLAIGDAAMAIGPLRVLLRAAEDNNLAPVDQMEGFGAVLDIVDMAARQLTQLSEITKQIAAENGVQVVEVL